MTGEPTAKGRAYVEWRRTFDAAVADPMSTFGDGYEAGYEAGAQAEYENVVEQANDKIKRTADAVDVAVAEAMAEVDAKRLEVITLTGQLAGARHELAKLRSMLKEV